jgi:hypothetical protein
MRRELPDRRAEYNRGEHLDIEVAVEWPMRRQLGAIDWPHRQIPSAVARPKTL